jgi:hypothetical protein
VGPDLYHNYTPATEGFDFYFTLSQNGKFESYRNGLLEDKFVLSSVEYENVGQNFNLLLLKINCNENEFDLDKLVSNITNDTIRTFYCPINFIDAEAKRIEIYFFCP